MQIMDADPKPRIRANAQIATSTSAARRRCKIFNVDPEDGRNICGYGFIWLLQLAYMVEVFAIHRGKRSLRRVFKVASSFDR